MTVRRVPLPEVVAVEAAAVRYPEPRIYFDGPEERRATEAVEILVETRRPWPATDLPPILFVGDLALPEYEVAARNRYRFFAFRPDRLEAGAPITVGWPYAADRKVATGFRFNLGGPRVA